MLSSNELVAVFKAAFAASIALELAAAAEPLRSVCDATLPAVTVIEPLIVRDSSDASHFNWSPSEKSPVLSK